MARKSFADYVRKSQARQLEDYESAVKKRQDALAETGGIELPDTPAVPSKPYAPQYSSKPLRSFAAYVKDQQQQTEPRIMKEQPVYEPEAPSSTVASKTTTQAVQSSQDDAYIADQIARDYKAMKRISARDVLQWQKGQSTSAAERAKLANDLVSGRVNISDITPEQVPWDQLLRKYPYAKVAAIGIRNPQKGLSYLSTLQQKLNGSAADRQSLTKPSFASGLKQGLVTGLALGVPEQAEGRTTAEKIGQFTGNVVGMIPGIAAAASTGGAGAAGAALRAAPQLAGRSALARSALGTIQALGTGATLSAGQEAVRAGLTGEFDPAQAVKRAAGTTATYGAFGAAYPLANQAVGMLGRQIAQRVPAAAQTAQRIGQTVPAAQAVAEGVPSGAIAGGMVGAGQGVINAFRGDDAKGFVQSVLENAKEEASENLVEAIAYGITRGLIRPTSASVLQSAKTLKQAQVETPQAKVSTSEPPQTPPVAREPTSPVQPTTPQEQVAQETSPFQRRVQAVRNANPGMDEQAIGDLVTTTSKLSDEDFTNYLDRMNATTERLKQEEGAPEPEEGILSSQVKKPAQLSHSLGDTVNAGDKVRIQGRTGTFAVVDTSDPSLLRVRSDGGAEMQVGRSVVRPVDQAVVSEPDATIAKQPDEVTPSQPITVYRRDTGSANLSATERPQGLYLSLVHDRDTFDSPHKDAGDTDYWGTVNAQNPLTVEGTKVEHARFGKGRKGEVSAGVAALKNLLPADEFERVRTMKKADLVNLLNEQFPGPDYTQYHDSYELMEAYGAQLARKNGYDAIVLEDKSMPEFSEVVALTDEAVSFDGNKAQPQTAQAKSTRPITSQATEFNGRKDLPALKDNYRKPLATYTDALYRETSADGAFAYIPGANATDPAVEGEVFFANTPDLATGQGQNKGIMLEFDSANLAGRVNTKKPGWQLAYEQGQVELVSSGNSAKQMQKALRSITIKPDAKMTAGDRTRLVRTLAKLESQGWTRVEGEDGAVTYRRQNMETAGNQTASDNSQQSKQPAATQNDAGQTAAVNRELPTNRKTGTRTQGFAGQRPSVPQSATKPTETVKRREIVKLLETSFGKMKTGGVRRKLLGQFNTKTGVIRTRLPEDFPVQMHEIGHKLDQDLGLALPRYDQELLALGEQTTPKAQMDDTEYRRAEGVAEFLRLYLTNPTEAQQKAPGYYAAFETKMAANPDVHDSLLEARRMVERFMSQSPRDKILAAVSVDEKGKPLPNTPTRIYARTVDQLAPVAKVVQTLSKGSKLKVDEDPYAMGVLARGWAGKPKTWIERGVTDDDFNFVSEPLNAVLNDVDNLDDFRAYLVAKRSKELMQKRGFKVEQTVGVGITPEEVDAVIAEFEPKYGSVQQRLVKFQNYLVDELVKSGVVSQEGADAMKRMNEDYVPFYRFFDDSLGTFNIAGAAKFANVGNPVKRIKGSSRTIIDPIESVLKNTYIMLNVATRNRVGRTFIEFVEKHGQVGSIAEKINTPMRPVNFELGQIESFLQDNGIDVDKADLKKVATVFTPTGRPNASRYQLTIMRDGKREYWEVDPEIYRALLFLDEESTATWVKILGTPASVLRAGAVLSPEFLGSNPVRDQWTAFINSEYGYIPGVDLVRGTFDVIGKSDLYYKWMASGGAQASLVSLDRKSLQKQLKGYLDDLRLKRESGAVKTGHVLKKVVNPVEWLEALRSVSEASDTATRMGEFRKGVATEGMTREGIQRASLSARDFTTDFSRRGSQTQTLNRLTAFFNAQLQGLDKTARVMRKAPLRTTMRATAIFTVPTIILYLMNRDNPYWEEKDQWQKDLFFLVPVPGTEDSNGHAKNFLYLPKGHAMAMVFGSAVERILRWADKEDPMAFEDFAAQLLGSVSPSAPVPTALMPLIENMANYDFFTDLPVVPVREQRLDPADQYNVYTSNTARILGKVTNTSWARKIGLEVSPRKVDNLISGYGGGLGKLLVGDVIGAGLREAEILTEGKSGAVARPSRGLAGVPFVKAFARDAAGMGTGSSVDQFYNELDKAESVNTRIKRTAEQGETPELTDADRQSLARLSGLRKIDRQMQDLRAARRSVENDADMTADEKREAINALELTMTNLARMTLGKYPIQN